MREARMVDSYVDSAHFSCFPIPEPRSPDQFDPVIEHPVALEDISGDEGPTVQNQWQPVAIVLPHLDAAYLGGRRW